MGADDIDGINATYAGQLGTGRVNALRSLKRDLAPLKITDVSYDNVTQILSLKIRGVLRGTSLSRGSIVVTDANGGAYIAHLDGVNIKQVGSYYVGTNSLRFKLPLKSGSYIIKTLASRIRDPFGRQLDGDNDGLPGGDWRAELTIP
jgi:hypothetical protein